LDERAGPMGPPLALCWASGGKRAGPMGPPLALCCGGGEEWAIIGCPGARTCGAVRADAWRIDRPSR